MGQSSSSMSIEELNNLKKIQDEQIEARIAHENLLFLQKEAFKLTEKREQFFWEVLAAGTMTAVLLVAGSVFKRKDLVVPIAGLIMGAGYRYDSAYGTHYSIVKEQADELFKKKQDYLNFVGGPLTLSEVDSYRKSLYR